MKILLVEDNVSFIEEFCEQLSQIGEVITFKSANSAIKWLHINGNSVDLVVCDHYILRFEEESNSKATGEEIYFELRFSQKTVPFIHFSTDPCPKLYEAEKDQNFYSLAKSLDVNLICFINDKKIIKIL